MNSADHSYGKLNKSNNSWFFVLSVVFIGIGLIFLAVAIYAWVNQSSASTFFWYFVMFAVWSPFVLVFISHLFSDVRVNEEGLQTRFLYKSLILKWEDISEVKRSKPFGLPIGKRASVLVVRRGLTFFHRVYGLVYGQSLQPALVIWSHVSGYNVLMKEISKNRKGKKSSS